MFSRESLLRVTVSLVSLLVLSSFASAQTEPTRKIELRRIGHRQMFYSGVGDASGSKQAYLSLSGLGDGRIVAVPDYCRPSAFRLHPEGIVEVLVAFAGDDYGNEDNSRGQIVATKTGSMRHWFWQMGAWGVNDLLMTRAETASYGPIGSVRTPLGTGYGGIGYGVDFDNKNNIVFAGMTHHGQPHKELMTAFRLEYDDTKSTLTGRTLVLESEGTSGSVNQYMVRCDPEHNLVALAFCEGNGRGKLHLVEYTPQKQGDAIVVKALHVQAEGRDRTGMIPEGLDIKSQLRGARSGDFAVSGGRLYLLMGGINGISVFDIGPEGGPYELSKPKAIITLPNWARFVRVHGKQVIVSAHGLYAFDLDSVAEATGRADIKPDTVYRLPYETHEFAVETIDSKDYLVLACGVNGFDVFAFAGGAGSIKGQILACDQDVTLEGGKAKLALKTGGGIRHINAPVLNDNGDMALWAVTDNQREAILVKKKGGEWRVAAITGRDNYTSFSSPSINNMATVVCYVGKSDGGEAILRIDDAGVTEISAGDDIKWLMHPEIADDGAIAFLETSADGYEQLKCRSADGTVQEVCKAEAWKLGEDYDIGPDGQVAYVCSVQDPKNTRRWNKRLHIWQAGAGSAIVDSLQGAPHFPKVGKDGIVCLRVTGNELEQVRTYHNSKFTFIATHRPGFVNRTYGFRWNAVKPGMAISNGKAIFTAHTYKYPFGPWLLKYNSETDCERLTKPGDKVDDKTIIDVTFKGGFNEKEALNFILDLKDASGKVSQALVTMGVE